MQNPGITHFEASSAGCTLEYGDGKHDRPCGPSIPEEAISKSVLINWGFQHPFRSAVMIWYHGMSKGFTMPLSV